MRIPSILLLALALSGCAAALDWANRPPVTQGNLLSGEDIAALEPGMTRAQIRERIGGPVLGNGFRPEHWDYIYYNTRAGDGMGERQHLRLYFDGDVLVRVDDNYEPPPPPEPEDLELPPEPDPMQQAPVPTTDGPSGPEQRDPL